MMFCPHQIWPLWWRISFLIRVQTTLNHCRFFFYHNITSDKKILSARDHCATNWRKHRCLFSSRQQQIRLQHYCQLWLKNQIFLHTLTMRMRPCFTLVCLCRCFLCFFNSIVKRLQRQHELQCFDIHQTVNITLLLKKLKCWFNQLSKWFPVFITERMLNKFDQSREGYTILTWKRKRDSEGFFGIVTIHPLKRSESETHK